MLLYDAVYQFITLYVLPATMDNIADYEKTLFTVCFVVTLGIFWACIVRPFWWFFKYGIFGGSKKNPLERK